MPRLWFQDLGPQYGGDDDGQQASHGKHDVISQSSRMRILDRGNQKQHCWCEHHCDDDDGHESLVLELDSYQQRVGLQLLEFCDERHGMQALELVLLLHEHHQLHNQSLVSIFKFYQVYITSHQVQELLMTIP